MSLTPQHVAGRMQDITANLSKVIEGKEDKVEFLVLGLIAGGHILIEDIPGVGKTSLARSLAKTIEGRFSRIQFTPDLLPSDITGINVYQQSLEKFTFKSGPIFANILLADEINRASPRTQSALLEAMSEEHVTIDGQKHPLPQPFIVLATQNPVEYYGTYPLPEAQLDRFMLQIDLGYPPLEIEHSLVINRTSRDPVEDISTVIPLDELNRLRASVDHVKMEASVSAYLMHIVTATRHHPQIQLGVSTRGSLLYARICRAMALSQGRDYVIPEDVKKLAIPVLSHRIILAAKDQHSGLSSVDVLRTILDQQYVPR